MSNSAGAIIINSRTYETWHALTRRLHITCRLILNVYGFLTRDDSFNVSRGFNGNINVYCIFLCHRHAHKH